MSCLSFFVERIYETGNCRFSNSNRGSYTAADRAGTDSYSSMPAVPGSGAGLLLSRAAS